MPTIKSKCQLFKEFVALKEVSDSGQISSVAYKNGIKPTNLSKLITSLEERLHTTLISRTAKGIYPLSEAVKINEITDRILNEFDLLYAQYHDEKKLTGAISIWAEEDYIGNYFLEKLQRFSQQFPCLKINIFSGDKVNLSQMDIIISSELPKSVNVETIYQQKMRNYFYASKIYYERYGEPKGLKELLEKHILCMRYRDIKDKEFGEIVRQAKHLNFKADATSIIFKIVNHGDAIGILPEWIGDINTSLVKLQKKFMVFEKDFFVMQNKDTKNKVLMKSIISFINKFIMDRQKGLIK